MLALKVRLLHGWYRAAGRGDGALMGSLAQDAAEWPPSPARVVAALVSGGGTGERRVVPCDDSELLALEAAGPPVIFADPLVDHDEREQVIRTELVERFVVIDETLSKGGSVQNYPARVSATARPGVRIVPRHPVITYVWPGLELTPDQRAALVMRCARVGYIGASDAPAYVTVLDELPESASQWVPDPAGSVAIAVPFPGYLDVLDHAFAAFQRGAGRPGSTLRREFVRYRTPTEPVASVRPPQRPLLFVRFDQPYVGHRVLPVSEALKGLVLASFADIGQPGEAPAVLTGHGLAPGDEPTRFWPLPNVGDRGDGRLFGACVAFPTDVAPELVQRVRAALDGSELRVAGAGPRTVTLFGGEPGPWTSTPRRWQSSATHWVSATPVVLPRHPNGELTLNAVVRLCAESGLPAPARFRFTKVPLIGGGVDLRPHQTVRKGNKPRPYGHLELWWDEPVPGPMALGHMRSFGLGLMAPVRSRQDRAAQPESEEAA